MLELQFVFEKELFGYWGQYFLFKGKSCFSWSWYVSLDYVINCIDSLDVFRKHFPELQAYNQPYLVQRFLKDRNTSTAHEAVGDCANLKNLIEAGASKKNISLSTFLDLKKSSTLFWIGECKSIKQNCLEWHKKTNSVNNCLG